MVGTANQWYMVTGAVVGIAAQRYMEYQCHGFANHPHSRAIVGIGKVTRGDSAGFFCEEFHVTASDVCYNFFRHEGLLLGWA